MHAQQTKCVGCHESSAKRGRAAAEADIRKVGSSQISTLT